MKTLQKLFLIVFFIMFICTLTGCDFLNSKDDVKKYDDELVSSTGKWLLQNDEDTYFVFDGTKNVMKYSYVEDGINKYNGTYKVIYRGLGEDVLTPYTLIFTRSDKEKADWIGCYVEDFENNFTQFTIMSEEEDLGNIDGSIYTHIYRISELPYKMGSYILEGNEYKEESNNYGDASEFCIPSGTYTLETGESFTFLYTKSRSIELFQYKNGDAIIEGSINIAEDKKTIYLYIENDPYNKVTKVDKEHYDTTFNIYYPPDFYLRGDFSIFDKIIINDLYRHTETLSKIEDSLWVFGTYNKINN